MLYIDPDKELYAVIPDIQRIAWIWALVFAFSVPEIGVFMRAARICFFRNIRKATWCELLIVWIFESFHVVGLGLFTFLILPELDVIKGIMLTNAILLIPSILSIISIKLEMLFSTF